MNQNELRLAVQSYCFAAHDMLLYLDTHKEDKKAFSIYKALRTKADDLKDQYQQKYGPLCVSDLAKQDEFNWTDSPWPWEKGANSDV